MRLSWNLFENDAAPRDKTLLSYAPGADAVTYVRIDNGANDETLEIAALREDGSLLMRKLLSKNAGDFSCGPDGLSISGRRPEYAPVAIGLEWAIVSRTRVFNTSVAGRLVMQIKYGATGMALYLPYTHFSEYRWVRWNRVNEGREIAVAPR